jgi:enamine deaminase RidA (YjgF/YER057c/UK114 family)
MTTREVTVPGWPAPKGYANGRIGEGGALYVGGQIGWDERGAFPPGGLVPQLARALDNVLAVVRAAGGAAEDIASMTVFVTSIDEYRAAQRALGPVWRERMGRHYPAMALVAVTALVEPEAVVEIQAIASIPEAPPGSPGSAPGSPGSAPGSPEGRP